MCRDEALALLSEIPYPSDQHLKDDYDYVIKKLNYTETEFQEYIARPAKRHDDYPNSRNLLEFLKKLHRSVC
jgi:hypothetical protein